MWYWCLSLSAESEVVDVHCSSCNRCGFGLLVNLNPHTACSISHSTVLIFMSIILLLCIHLCLFLNHVELYMPLTSTGCDGMSFNNNNDYVSTINDICVDVVGLQSQHAHLEEADSLNFSILLIVKEIIIIMCFCYNASSSFSKVDNEMEQHLRYQLRLYSDDVQIVNYKTN